MIDPELLKAATVKWFCSFDCTNEAVGEVKVITGVIASNNPLKQPIEFLPICQEHLDNLEKK